MSFLDDDEHWSNWGKRPVERKRLRGFRARVAEAIADWIALLRPSER